MTTDQHKAYATAEKKFWVIYTVIAIAVLLFLALVVAQDNEEKVFYTLMGGAVAYVFRPSRAFTAASVQRWFGVAKSEEKPEEKLEKKLEEKSEEKPE